MVEPPPARNHPVPSPPTMTGRYRLRPGRRQTRPPAPCRTGRHASDPREREVLDVGLVDFRQRAVAPAGVVPE